MNREPDAGGPGHLTPETLAELEELVRMKLRGRVREFRLSIRDAGLVLRGRAQSHHAKQLAQQALMDSNRATITANEIEVRDCPFPSRTPT
jgi:hypothetical protein